MRDAPSEVGISLKTGVPGLSGLLESFQALFANPPGSASHVLLANIYVSRFLFARIFWEWLLAFIHP